LILRGIERAVEESTPKPFDLTNEQIHDLIEFP
jgi:hypothetical protein